MRHDLPSAITRSGLFRRSVRGHAVHGVRRFGLGLILAGLAVCGSGQPARAQVQDDEDEPEVQAPVNQGFMIDESNFDMWIFGNSRNAAGALGRLESVLQLKIAELDRVVHLTDAQRKKLELASRGDIKRFFDRVDVKRKAFQLVRTDQQKFAAFYQQIQPLHQLFHQGLFGDDSLFFKTVRKTLDEGQVARYDDLSRQRRVLRHQAKLGRVLATLDSSLALEISQRNRLSKLIVEETRVPRRSTNYDFYVVIYQLAQLPEARIKPIFHEAQWAVMSQLLGRAKGFKAMLTQQGVLPGESDADAWIVAADSEAPHAPATETKKD